MVSKKMGIGFALFCILWAAGASGEAATLKYVWDGAQGDGSGSDWANAYAAIPAELQRDTVYYFAAGDYGYKIIDTPVNGETQIVFKKATPADHGTGAGWSDSMAGAQAEFAGIQLQTSYFTMDGSTGSGSGGNGFRVRNGGKDSLFLLPAGFAHNHITITRCEMTFDRLDVDNGYGGVAVEAKDSNDVKVQNCFIHDVACPISWSGNSNMLVEYNTIARNQSTAVWHSEGIAAHYTSDVTIRYNTFEDIEGTGMIASLSGSVQNWEIYGNLFFYSEGGTRTGAGHGIFTTNVPENSITGLKFYNNTIANIAQGNSTRGVLIPGHGADVSIRNNLWFCDKGSACVAADHSVASGAYVADQNWYSSSVAHPPEANAQNGGTSNPFVSVANKDFRLRSGTNPGATLSPPYNVDAAGHPRGADGAWDRGAFEYAGEQHPAPQNLRIVK